MKTLSMKSLILSLTLAIGLGSVVAPKDADASVALIIAGYRNDVMTPTAIVGFSLMGGLIVGGPVIGAGFSDSIDPDTQDVLGLIAGAILVLDARGVAADAIASDFQKLFSFVDDASALARLSHMTVAKYNDSAEFANGMKVVHFTMDEIKDATNGLDLTQQELEAMYRRLK